MKTNIGAVVFDFGGVLIGWDPRNLYRDYFPDRASMERFLEEVNFMEWNALQDKGRSFDEGAAALSREFPRYRDLIRAYRDHWELSLGGEIRETVAILRRLKRQGYALYGLSNWSAETFPIARKKHSFFDLLDDMVISGSVGLIKPDPEIYRYLLNKTKRKADECLFIDDSEKNVLAARQLGFAAVHYQSPVQLEAELSRLGILSKSQFAPSDLAIRRKLGGLGAPPKRFVKR
jgi:2-haloacid dehalogenase